MTTTALPISKPKYPTPVREVHQIEFASDCNLRCVYCPSRNLDKDVADGGHGRAKVFMEDATYDRALEHVAHLRDQGTQGELALTGLGETLMHPKFVEYLAWARDVLPEHPITISTNGILVTEELVEAIRPHRPQVYVSLHRPEKAKGAVDLLRNAGLLAGVNASFALDAFDWAGSLSWDVSIAENSVTCEFLRSGWCVILADGRVTACCLDASGAGVRGHVNDPLGSLVVAPWRGEGPIGETGCSKCHMNVP